MIRTNAGMQKNIDDHFADWEAYVFGFGYGSGEEHTIAALKKFLALCPMKGVYDYKELERELTPIVAWLLINVLCRHSVDILEYGTSPRVAWLSAEGKRLKEYCDAKTLDELLETVCRGENYTHCAPTYCNCGPHGLEEGRKCGNPFWVDRPRGATP